MEAKPSATIHNINDLKSCMATLHHQVGRVNEIFVPALRKLIVEKYDGPTTFHAFPSLEAVVDLVGAQDYEESDEGIRQIRTAFDTFLADDAPRQVDEVLASVLNSAMNQQQRQNHAAEVEVQEEEEEEEEEVQEEETQEKDNAKEKGEESEQQQKQQQEAEKQQQQREQQQQQSQQQKEEEESAKQEEQQQEKKSSAQQRREEHTRKADEDVLLGLSYELSANADKTVAAAEQQQAEAEKAKSESEAKKSKSHDAESTKHKRINAIMSASAAGMLAIAEVLKYKGAALCSNPVTAAAGAAMEAAAFKLELAAGGTMATAAVHMAISAKNSEDAAVAADTSKKAAEIFTMKKKTEKEHTAKAGAKQVEAHKKKEAAATAKVKAQQAEEESD